MTTRDYEAMFLLDNTAATADFEGTAGQVDKILLKHGTEIVHKEKWDERKLAYDIRGHRRATYYLVYLRAPTSAIREIETDLALSETVLRHMVMVLEEPIEVVRQRQAESREKMAEESRRASLAGWGEKKRERGGRRERGHAEEGEDEVFYEDVPDNRVVEDVGSDEGHR